jgi:two-component system response regulator ResD
MSNAKPTILYLDDDQDYLDSMRAILESAGYAMLEAPTAEAGLVAFREHRPDLIIVDLMMEEVDSGASFVKEIRASGSIVPIYMLSSVGDNLSQTADTSSLGLAGVFQKPIDREALLSVLQLKLGAGSTPAEEAAR